ncbi:hypothetical protein D3C84_644660 [compost metagenome]
MLLLTRRTQDAIERGLRRQITPLIGQARHDLAGRQVSVISAVAQRHNRLSLDLTQRITRRWSHDSRSSIGLNDLGAGPALQGS